MELGDYFLNLTTTDAFLNQINFPLDYSISGLYFYDTYSLTSYATEIDQLKLEYNYEKNIVIYPFQPFYLGWKNLYTGLFCDILNYITGGNLPGGVFSLLPQDGNFLLPNLAENIFKPPRNA
jgi:hypothetical protein